MCRCETEDQLCTPFKAIRILGTDNGANLDFSNVPEIEAFIFIAKLVDKWHALMAPVQQELNVSYEYFLFYIYYLKNDRYASWMTIMLELVLMM